MIWWVRDTIVLDDDKKMRVSRSAPEQYGARGSHATEWHNDRGYTIDGFICCLRWWVSCRVENVDKPDAIFQYILKLGTRSWEERCMLSDEHVECIRNHVVMCLLFKRVPTNGCHGIARYVLCDETCELFRNILRKKDEKNL